MKFTIQQIATLLQGEVQGNGQLPIHMLAKIQEAKSGEITFLSNPKYENFIYATQASAVVVHKNFVPRRPLQTTLILVEDPYSSFTKLIEEYQRALSFQKTGVENPSYIGKDSVVGENIYRGAFSFIGNHVRIGNHVKIFPQVYIGDDCVIGDRVILYPGAKLYAGVRIGNDCVISAGAVIGSEGFGFAPQTDGNYKSIPQLGSVIIEDHVNIGANTAIDRATLPGDATAIRQGVKLDNLIQIGHNVEIQKNTVMSAQVGIAGSTKVGEQCMFGGQVGISGHLTIANNTKIGAQGGVSKSITEEGTSVIGYPVFDHWAYFRSYAIFKKLPDVYHRLEEIEKKLTSSDK